MNLEEGPKEVVIPEQRFYSCFSCKHYDYRMIKSGNIPVYESTCKLLNSLGELILDDEFCVYNFQVSDKTPDCCPYLKGTIRNDKIDKIINDK